MASPILKRFSEEIGLFYDGKQPRLTGIYHSYPVTLTWLSSAQCVIISASGTAPEASQPAGGSVFPHPRTLKRHSLRYAERQPCGGRVQSAPPWRKADDGPFSIFWTASPRFSDKTAGSPPAKTAPPPRSALRR